jgi:hypothetical protein
MSLKRYDAAQVTVCLMGILVDSGFAEGEFLTIKQNAPDYEIVVGTDGQVTRSRTNNRSAEIELKLMQTSDGNTLLSAMSNTGLLTANGSDIGILLVRDRISGLCMYTAQNCWIAKPPDVTMDIKATSRVWTLNVDSLLRVDAGS